MKDKESPSTGLGLGYPLGAFGLFPTGGRSREDAVYQVH